MNKTDGKNGKINMRNEWKMEDCPFHTIYCCTACTSYIVYTAAYSCTDTAVHGIPVYDMRRVYRYSVGSNIHHHGAPLQVSGCFYTNTAVWLPGE